MKKIILLVMVMVLVIFMAHASDDCQSAEKTKGKSVDKINGLPLHVKQLSENAIRLWVGDYISSTAVCALNTDKGIVVIDTTQYPELDKHFRKIIAKKFGRNDFVYLINTHEHGDHTGGNQIYSDCEVVAHEKCAEGMKRVQGDVQRVISWYRENIPKQKDQLAKLEMNSEEYQKLRERVIVSKMTLKTLENGLNLQLPTKTFKEKMKLELGNMTLELFCMGGLHSASDIFILVPQEGLLFTGDVMADTWLTDTPGCLQSFGGRPGLERDLNLVLKNWSHLIERKDDIKQYIPGHWNGELSFKGFLERYQYLATLNKEINQGIKNGKGLEILLTDLKLDTRFPNLAGKPGFTHDFVHTNNVRSIWMEITGATSASDALAKMIDEKGIPEAVVEFRKYYQDRSKSNKYYYLEQDFNRLGYRYLNENKNAEAIAILELNVKMYPESWNVYDSLGEAYLKAGKKEDALKCYKKALTMNPQENEGQKKQYLQQKKILDDLKKTSH